ncbi:MAG: type II toxin-antitoxin system RelE/ParE family toxin [Candidatus Omnitrophica bacterium]|nr:type II toxin-antitoxin system RelE/ParE family toxin [Candidatus Omnitrophota bacterium]
MESSAWQEKVTEVYTVLWHHEIRQDFEELSESLSEKIVNAVQHRLSLAPTLGEPLKGTRRLVWRLRFSDYRILYTVNRRSREVWILSVKHRSVVYQNNHVQELVKWAVALQATHEQSGE